MERLKSRLGWALAGALGIVLVLALARATVAGPLDPPGPAGSTMRTIDELLPSWGKTLTSSGGCTSQRFTCVMSNAAVLDHETGLVWQRTPGQTTDPWRSANAGCRDGLFANRLGWRLPTLSEIFTLFDSATADGLPLQHPFLSYGVGNVFWTSTTDPTDAQAVFAMFFGGTGYYESLAKLRHGQSPFDLARAWCVRSPGGSEVVVPDEQPAWSRMLDATGGCNSARFECVLNSEAVLDHETGLVWQKSIGTDTATFSVAQIVCAGTSTGGVAGWRVPTLSELYTLLDPTRNNPSFSGPALPVGHPFQDIPVTGSHIWSVTDITGTTNAWAMRYGNWPAQPSETQITSMSFADYVFCVRGQQ